MGTREEERESAFGDAVYDTWMQGGNPDAVDRDEVDDVWYGAGAYDREQTAEIVTRRCLRRSRRAAPPAEGEQP